MKKYQYLYPLDLVAEDRPPGSYDIHYKCWTPVVGDHVIVLAERGQTDALIYCNADEYTANKLAKALFPDAEVVQVSTFDPTCKDVLKYNRPYVKPVNTDPGAIKSYAVVEYED